MNAIPFISTLLMAALPALRLSANPALAATVLAAQPAPAPLVPAASPAAPSTAPAQPLPSLDDLLKLPKSAQPVKPASPAAPAKPAEVPTDKPDTGSLERPARDGGAPSEQKNPLTEALDLMSDASLRLNPSPAQPAGSALAPDTSLQTQRLQQQAIDKLDQLISQAKKQQQKKKQQQQQKKDQSQQEPQQGQGDAQQPQQGQQDGQPGKKSKPGEKKPGGKTPGQSDGDEEGDRPGSEAGSLNPAMDAARASWGNLPARVRDMLMQGSGERYSSMYQQMTEDYYRKLAEKQREDKR